MKLVFIRGGAGKDRWDPYRGFARETAGLPWNKGTKAESFIKPSGTLASSEKDIYIFFFVKAEIASFSIAFFGIRIITPTYQSVSILGFPCACVLAIQPVLSKSCVANNSTMENTRNFLEIR